LRKNEEVGDFLIKEFFLFSVAAPLSMIGSLYMIGIRLELMRNGRRDIVQMIDFFDFSKNG
jgi:hypothetical protein